VKYCHVLFSMRFIVLIFFTMFLHISKELNIASISQFAMNMLKKKHHLNVDAQKRRSIFTKCIMCESFKDLISKLGKNNTNVK
jgi:cytochrome c2